MFALVFKLAASSWKDTSASVSLQNSIQREGPFVPRKQVFQGVPHRRLLHVSLSTPMRPPLERRLLGRRGWWVSVDSDNLQKVNYQKPLEFRKSGQGVKIQWQVLKSVSLFYILRVSAVRKYFRSQPPEHYAKLGKKPNPQSGIVYICLTQGLALKYAHCLLKIL